MGGGGGNDGYEQRQEATEAKKQAARDLLNAQFGVNAGTTAPDRASFTSPSSEGKWIERPGGGGAEGSTVGEFIPAKDAGFDEAGYNQAVGKFTQQQQLSDANAGSRDALYKGVRENAFNYGKTRLDEQADAAKRKTKFELFARGLNGGSEDIDQNALLKRTYNQGVMDLGAKADTAREEFRGADEQARLGMLQSIDAGMDQGTALSSAVQQLQINADKAAAGAQGTALNDLFATSDLIYNNSQAAKGREAGTEWWNTYQPSAVRGRATSGATGTVTKV